MFVFSIDKLYIKKNVICEGDTVTLSCPTGTRLQILDARYGRFLPGEQLCPNPAIHDFNCRAANSYFMVAATCDFVNSCTLTASSSVFGDPCPGTYKYLEVEYSCE